MRLAIRYLIATLAISVAGVALRAYGGWGTGGCGSPTGGFSRGPVWLPKAAPFSPPAAAPESEEYLWRIRPGGKGLCLFQGDHQVGWWHPAEGYFRLAGDDFESEPSDPPVSLPKFCVVGLPKDFCRCGRGCTCTLSGCKCKPGDRCSPRCDCRAKEEAKKKSACAAGCPCHHDGCDCGNGGPCEIGCQVVEGKSNFGVDTTKIHTEERYTIDGQIVPKAQAYAALVEGLEDDSHRLSLTVIGSKADCDRVLQDLQQPQFHEFASRCVVQDYRPDDWPMRVGFQTSGNPTIYLQKPDGQVLARTDKYEGPQTLEAVRKADPNYQPAKDPDPTKPKAPDASPLSVPGDGSDAVCFGGCGACVAAAVLASLKRRQQS